MDKINLVEVFMNGIKVGRMALTPQSLCAFEYDPAFIQTGHSISPFNLPLKQQLFISNRTPFNGNFGVFDDSLPDGWGNLILDRHLRSKGIDSSKLTILQRIALIGSRGRGALEYLPDYSSATPEQIDNLDKLAQESYKILSTNYYGESVKQLYKLGGSSGGARPKIFTKIDGKEWLIKFSATMDPTNIGEIEYNYSLLAQKCGIKMAQTKLFENQFFGVERFDRDGDIKVHTVSAAGLLSADYRIPSLDYIDLLRLCHSLTKNMEEVYALFRQMVFNIKIKNRDDHAKNFSFQLINGEWRLSPAYDLLPSSGFNGFHTTTINNSGDPSPKDIAIVAQKANLNSERANQIIDEIETLVQETVMTKALF